MVHARTSYATLTRTPVPQTAPLNERQVANNAGGFVFALDDWKRLDRFLILGSDAPTYYQSAQKLTRESAACVARCWAADPARTVARITEVSAAGRAPKNDSAIFAIALGTVQPGDGARREAFRGLSAVCRTATHLFQFIEMRTALGGGTGRGFKRAVAEWYRARSPADLAYQMIKYRTRAGQTHARVLERVDFGFKDAYHAAYRPLIQWVKGKLVDGLLPVQVQAHLKAMDPATSHGQLLDLIREHRLPWEAIPTAAKTDPDVWKALLPAMNIGAMVRELGKMTACGAVKPLSAESKHVCAVLGDVTAIRKARLHPLNILMALRVYEAGHSQAGMQRVALRRAAGQETADAATWTPVPAIAAALEEAFYLSFGAIAPADKRTLIALDVSGSMASPFGGTPMACCEATAAMAMTLLRTEPQTHVFGFASSFVELGITKAMRLREATERAQRANFGTTDCALGITYAQKHGLDVDTFVVMTDNETYAGSIHPVQALAAYRRKTGIPAKLIVVGMTATNFTIADPADGGMLDVVGFDQAAPAVMTAFSRGDL